MAKIKSGSNRGKNSMNRQKEAEALEALLALYFALVIEQGADPQHVQTAKEVASRILTEAGLIESSQRH